MRTPLRHPDLSGSEQRDLPLATDACLRMHLMNEEEIKPRETMRVVSLMRQETEQTEQSEVLVDDNGFGECTWNRESTAMFQSRGKQGHLIRARFLLARVSAVTLGDSVDSVEECLLVNGSVLVRFHDQIKRFQKIFFKPS
jgi:hypothetical protein